MAVRFWSISSLRSFATCPPLLRVFPPSDLSCGATPMGNHVRHRRSCRSSHGVMVVLVSLVAERRRSASIRPPVVTLRLPSNFCLVPIQDCLSTQSGSDPDANVKAGILGGLFHSALLVDAKFWIWEKSDGGRLGFSDEISLFVAYLNPNLKGVRSIALGGIHSTVLTRSGEDIKVY